ncbi:Tpr-related protein family member, putative [Theileria annulata]|uniref:Tpr-related protein family member, putative n=1 Tax=Theileria annulata TaxID=5874 RepID=Q4UA05_THEAN|nr:Tpr-related protein family member, putative [Theileria annulata]CAI76348.1 Tpr-related protein family member, putative [Theileria annulata]|eukprot:XP_952972.1 Tpr-related protein family member, putative [Theileria annulata]
MTSSGDPNPTTNYQQDDDKDRPLQILAYMFAGLAMMLNIRLSYSAAPFALLRFKLPENLFSVFVRTTSSALELWCIPSMLLGNIMEQVYNQTQDTAIGIHATNLKETAGSTDGEKLQGKAGTLHSEATKLETALNSDPAAGLVTALKEASSKPSASSEDEKGLKELLESFHNAQPTDVVAKAQKVIKKYNEVAGKYKEVKNDAKASKNPAFTQVKSAFEDLQKEYSDAIYKYKFWVITIPSMVTNWLNFLTFVILLIVFVTGGDQGHVTGYYVIMAISGFVFGINMVLVYAVDYRYLPFYMAGENSFPMVTSMILYFATSIFGNRRKYNSDYLVVVIDVSIAIVIAFVASVLWTWAFYNYRAPKYGGLEPKWPELVSPVAMVIVGMGLVYAIYPAIAPGMIVPFYLIDKIEMVLLVATAFPPVIIAILRLKAPDWSPQTDFLLHSGIYKFGGWKDYKANDFEGGGVKAGDHVYGWIWHFFDIMIPLQICLAIIFIYSLHYRDSSISRSIVNQPKMSTFLTIVFYMCHEIMLALGFPGMVGNGGAGGDVLLPVQYVGALLMVFLAFYSIGYITEYKRHDPSEWPTDGMTWWNALCYWLKMASKITNKNFKQLFTTDLMIDSKFK